MACRLHDAVLLHNMTTWQVICSLGEQDRELVVGLLASGSDKGCAQGMPVWISVPQCRHAPAFQASSN